MQPLLKCLRSFLEEKVPEVFNSNFSPSYPALIVGISGGADSVALLSSLVRIGIPVLAVHCNFCLRGQESDRDEHFTTALCRRLQVPLRVFRCDVNSFLNEHPSLSVEMACRDIRYDIFRKLLSETGALRIAVAHNSDDNIETALLNLFRGTGIAGLRGMLPDTGQIIRPLLSSSRSEIESYLSAINQDYITDSTNLSSGYRRNFIRNEIIPLIESRWPGVRKSILRTLCNLREDEVLLSNIEKTYLPSSSHRLIPSEVKPPLSLKWAIGKFASRFSLGNNSDSIYKAVSTQPFPGSREWCGPIGSIRMERDLLQFLPVSFSNQKNQNDLLSQYDIVWQVYEMSSELFSQISTAPLSEVWLPGEPDDYLIRSRREGDTIAPIGMTGTKKISKLMKDAHFSREKKESCLLIEHISSGEIVWVAGLCRSRHFLLKPYDARAWRLIIQ